MNIDNIRAELGNMKNSDPNLSKAQQAGFQSGWQLAAVTPVNALAKGAIELVAEALHAKHDDESMGRLLGFLAFHESLTQQVIDALPRRSWAARLMRRVIAI